jgi:hypothetical protein
MMKNIFHVLFSSFLIIKIISKIKKEEGQKQVAVKEHN